jgi:DNA primase
LSTYPQSFIEDLRGRLSLSDVVGRHVQWDRRKTNAAKRDYWACCPFHSERSPSFHVDDSKGFYKCFGCGQSGDAITFLIEYEKRSFVEAVEDLAHMAGVPLPERTEAVIAQDNANDRLRAVNEAARHWFEGQLAGPKGAAARAYLVRRGIRAEVAAKWSLGYAPGEWRGLAPELMRLGFTKAEIVEAGLGIVPDDNPGADPHDRFRDRLMFPIRDPRGRVIAFGGRAMAADAQAKYLNSPETPLFHKGRTLFNLHAARRPAVETGRIVVAEGYMDVIALGDAGIAEAVAPLGTALTEDQLQILWKLAAEPILCLDGDKAGLAAAMRALDRALPLLKPGYSLRFALLPDGKDPDDLVRSDGPAAMEQVLAAARPLADLLWQRETDGGVPQTPERRAGLEARVMKAISVIGDSAVKTHYQRDMRARLQALFQPGRANFDRPKTGRAPMPARFGGRNPAFRGPVAPSRSLTDSALVRNTEPPHEKLIDLVFGIFLNFSDHLVDNVERLAALEPHSLWRQRLRDAFIALAHRNHLDSAVINDHFNTEGLGPEVDALRQRVLSNPDWAAARPGADGVAAAALLSRSFDMIETGFAEVEAAARANHLVMDDELDAELIEQIRAARRDSETARALADVKDEPAIGM